MSSLYENYINVCKQIDELSKAKENLLVEIWRENEKEYESKQTGKIDIKRDGFNISFTKKESVKIIDIESMMNKFPVLCNVKTSVTLVKKEYDKLPISAKKTVDSFLEVKPSKPTLVVKRLED